MWNWLKGSDAAAINTIISIIGFFITIIGFALNIYVFRTIRSIKKRFLFVARVPELITQLEGRKSTVFQHIQDFDLRQDEIDFEISHIEVLLRSLSKKIDKPYSKEIHDIALKIKAYSLSKNKNKLRDIVVELNKVIASIEDMQKDMRWE